MQLPISDANKPHSIPTLNASEIRTPFATVPSMAHWAPLTWESP